MDTVSKYKKSAYMKSLIPLRACLKTNVNNK